MTEEIKEILNKLKYIVDFPIIEHDTSFNPDNVEESVCLLVPNECKLLLDYITNLQQENKKLKQCYCNRTDCGGRIKDSKKYDSVQQRLDKIIAHLGNCDWNNKDFEKIYDIATGSDKNE